MTNSRTEARAAEFLDARGFTSDVISRSSVIDLLLAFTEPAAAMPDWTCAARKQGTAGGNDPADCDWPICGCDPYADKVIAALEESGKLPAAAMPGVPEREAIARIIDPVAFKSHRSLYDYCIAQGDTMDQADKIADDTHKPDCDRALAKADAILALIPSHSGETGEWLPIESAPQDGEYQWIGRGGDFPFADWLRWSGERWEFSDGSYLDPSYGDLLYHPLPAPPATPNDGGRDDA